MTINVTTPSKVKVIAYDCINWMSNGDQLMAILKRLLFLIFGDFAAERTKL